MFVYELSGCGFECCCMHLDISINLKALGDVTMMQDPVIAAIEKYKQHPCILKIKQLIRTENYFHFKLIDDEKMAEKLKNLNAK